MRILLVEDDPSVSDLTGNLLRRMGFAVVHFQSPEQLERELKSLKLL